VNAESKIILVLGAGRSSSVLIAYLLQEAQVNGWRIIVADVSEAAAHERIGTSPAGKAIRFDIKDERTSRAIIAQADVVISLLPAAFHPVVARFCIELEKHLITASYVSNEMQLFDEEARQKNILLLNECGLDPGIDHMSVMQVLDKIRDVNGRIISIESFTGGLIAPETDSENPWRYKFTWNPRNVVVAGQSTAKYLHDGRYKYIPYQKLFDRTTNVMIDGVGMFEGYANRDSISYRETYHLPEVETILRGTLRYEGYCSAWNIFVQLGCCDDTYLMDDVQHMTHRDFIDAFLDDSPLQIKEKIARYCNLDPNGPELGKLTWSGFFTDELVGLTMGTPAQILEHILNKKWKLSPADKDLIVMWHRFVYETGTVRREIQSSLVVTGQDSTHTGMAKTVGLPLGIATSLLLKGAITLRGVAIPVHRELYNPILLELRQHGVALKEKEIDL